MDAHSRRVADRTQHDGTNSTNQAVEFLVSRVELNLSD
jgi:hypothetical protein